eukprot:1704655-Prymnesium_polylepis.2
MLRITPSMALSFWRVHTRLAPFACAWKRSVRVRSFLNCGDGRRERRAAQSEVAGRGAAATAAADAHGPAAGHARARLGVPCHAALAPPPRRTQPRTRPTCARARRRGRRSARWSRRPGAPPTAAARAPGSRSPSRSRPAR